jgi:RND family efflux transporter MFP subunit
MKNPLILRYGNTKELHFKLFYQAAVISLSVFFAIFITSCKHENTTKEIVPEKFQVINPVVRDTVITREYIADIQSVQNVEIRAKLRGFIENIYVDEGKPVQQGQIIFTLSNQELQEDLRKLNAQMNSALAESKIAEIELNNTRTLLEKNIVSQPEFDMAKAKVDASQARIEECRSAISGAEFNLSLTKIRAPFSGIINRIPNKIGSLIEEGALLTTISNNKDVFAYFNVSEKEYLDFIKSKDLANQKEVTLVLADNQTYPYKGTIETVEGEFDKNTGNIAFRAKFPNPEQILKHGCSGKILVNNVLKNALLVPQKSTFEIQGNIYVYLVDNDNAVQLRKITPSQRISLSYAITSGLTANDKFIYEGIQLVKEGDKIIPEPIHPKEVAQLIN